MEWVKIFEINGIGTFGLESYISDSISIRGEELRGFKIYSEKLRSKSLSGASELVGGVILNQYDDIIHIYDEELFKLCKVTLIIQIDIELYRMGIIPIGLQFTCDGANNPFFRRIVLTSPFNDDLSIVLNRLDSYGVLDIDEFAIKTNKMYMKSNTEEGRIWRDILVQSYKKIYNSLTNESKLKVELLGGI